MYAFRLPVHIHDLMVSLGRAERNFVAQNSRKPSAEELAERLALPLPKVSDGYGMRHRDVEGD